MDTPFREARTYSKWQPRPIADKTLHELYDVLVMEEAGARVPRTDIWRDAP